MESIKKVGNFIQTIFGFLTDFLSLDKRSLALFRILLGLVIIYDLYTRFLDLEPHYSDDGIFPRYWLLDKQTYLMNGDLILNFHFISGDFRIQVKHYFILFYFILFNQTNTTQRILFIIHFMLAIFFVFGYHSKLNSIFLWILQNSLINRTTLTMHGGDFYIRSILFWTIFLPVSDCFSIDSAFERILSENQKNKNYKYFSGITIALVKKKSPHTKSFIYLIHIFSKNSIFKLQ